MGSYIITDFGARADGVTVCTKAIQKAIDACDKDGVVVIPQGTFISGALFLKSNMTLHLEKGARLLGSSELSDFPVIGYSFEGYEQLCYASLLNTHMAPNENITIEGEGVIDANGEKLFALEMKENKGKRGRALYIRNIRYENCTHVNRDEEHKDCKWFRGAIYMDAFYGYDEFDADTPAEITEGTPVVENIEFHNLTVDTNGGNAIYLCGLPERPFRNIRMKNIQACGLKGMAHKNIENLIMENVQIMEYGV